MSYLLSTKDLHVHYDKVESLKGISIDVTESNIVTILGSNGAGKTTTVRTISGLVKPSAGEIWFKGERIDKLLPFQVLQRGIAHVPEGRGLYPYMSVYDNLMMGAYLRRDKTEIRRNLETVYKHFPILKERKRQNAGTLSGGEQQMAAIGRGLMASPELMIFDEPTLGLSPLMVKEVARIIKIINTEQKVTILLIEQNARMALALSNYAYVLGTGSILQHGEAKNMINDEQIKKAYLGG